MVEELLNHRLVAVERLCWDGAGRRDVGPVRLVFDTGHALVLAGGSAWTLDYRVTGPGDDSWLGPFGYVMDGHRWVLRSATNEEPFAGSVGGALTDWQPVLNDVQEVVGLRLWFDGRELVLRLRNGELSA